MKTGELLNKNCLFLGIFITMIGLKFKIGPIAVYPSSILLYTLIILLFIDSDFKIVKRLNFFLVWLILNIFSSFSVIYLDRTMNWSISSISFIFQIISLWMPLLYLIKTKNKNEYIYYFEKGFKISIILQAIWAIIELFSWILFQFQLNTFIFGKILGFDYLGRDWTVLNFSLGIPIVRVAGIGWDPAYLAILMIIGIFIFKQNYLKILFFLILLLTSSRTGMLALFCIIIFYLLPKFIIKKRKKVFTKKKIVSFLVGITLIVYIINKNEIAGNMWNLTTKRFSIENKKEDKGDERHMLYYPLSVEVMFGRSNIYRMLFGYGLRTSGYIFDNYEDIEKKLHWKKDKEKAWIPETDLVAIFGGNGLIGVIIFVFMFYFNIYYNKNNNFLKYSNLAIFFSGISYTYLNLQWVLFVLMISSLNYNLLKKREEIYEHRDKCTDIKEK